MNPAAPVTHTVCMALPFNCFPLVQLLKIEIQQTDRRLVLTGTHHGYGILEFDVDFHFCPNISAQPREDFPEKLIVETIGFHNLKCQVPQTRLDNLKLSDDIIEVLEVMHEEGARQIVAVGTDDDGLSAPLDAADPRQPATARARCAGVHSNRQITDPVTNKGRAAIVQISDDHLAEFPWLCPASFLQNFHDVVLSHHKMAIVSIGFIRNTRELPTPVLVEDAASESGFDNLPTLAW